MTISEIYRKKDILVNEKCVVIVNLKRSWDNVVSISNISLMWICCLQILDMVGAVLKGPL